MSQPEVVIHEFVDYYSDDYTTGKDVEHHVVYVYIITVDGIIRYVGESGVISARRNHHASKLFRDKNFVFYTVAACHANLSVVAVLMAKHVESGLMLQLHVDLWNREVVQARKFKFQTAAGTARRVCRDHQHLMMEQRFKNDIYIEGQERDEFAASLGLTVKQGRNWFMHRRVRMRRQAGGGTGDEAQEEGGEQGQEGAEPNQLVPWAEVVMDVDQVEEVAGEGEGHGQNRRQSRQPQSRTHPLRLPLLSYTSTNSD